MNSRSLARLLVLSISILALLAPTATAEAARVGTRIVNADTTATVPWQIALVARNSSGQPVLPAVFCGGSIRDATHVITAAHCLPDRDPADFAVVAGQYDRTADPDDTTPGGPKPDRQVVNVASISSHPGFDEATTNNDMAILTLQSPGIAGVDQSGTGVQSMPVIEGNTPSNQVIGAQALISGWGLTDPDDDDSQPGPLLAAIINVFADSACDPYGNDYIDATMLCAGRDNGDGTLTDACQGDSGGPLARRVGTTGLTFDRLIGIVSFGIGCAQAPFFGVYTDLLNQDFNARLIEANPPARTVNSVPPEISGNPVVGETLTCNPGSWSASPTFEYLWIWVPIVNGQPDESNALVVGNQQQYDVVPEDEGGLLLCQVRATSQGGWREALSDAVLVDSVGSGSPGGGGSGGGGGTGGGGGITVDTTRPTSRFTRRSCRRRTCTLVLLITDPGGTGGARVRASISRLTGCPRGRRGRRCRRARAIRARQVASGVFRIVARNLKPGRYRFTAVATDAAGNRGATTRVVLRVRRR
jgi:Trypsin